MKPSTSRCTTANTIAQVRKRRNSALNRSRMMFSLGWFASRSGRSRRRVVLGQEAVDGAVQAYRHALHATRAVCAQEVAEVVVLIDDDVVEQAIDALHLQQARHQLLVRPLERDIGHPISDA